MLEQLRHGAALCLGEGLVTLLDHAQAGDGQFEYLVSQANNTISMRSRIQIKKTYFLPADYDMLREFFNMVVKKHNEQIVLKKKK